MKTAVIASLESVDFAPASEAAEVAQNVKTIIGTVVGSVPLDRAFGVSGDAVDLPQPAARARITADIIEKVQRYEPRCRVDRVTYTADADGRLVPTLEVTLNVS